MRVIVRSPNDDDSSSKAYGAHEEPEHPDALTRRVYACDKRKAKFIQRQTAIAADLLVHQGWLPQPTP